MRIVLGIVLAALACNLGCGGGNKPDPFSRDILLADSQWSRNDVAMARGTLQQILAEDPENFYAQYRLAFLWLNEDPEKGIELMARAAALRPRHPGPVFMSGVAKTDLGRFSEGEKDMEKGFELALDHAGIAWPGDAGAAPDGLAELRRNRFTQAASRLASASAEQKDRPEYWFLYATALMRSGAPDSAWTAVEHALKMRSDYSEALALEGEILRAREKYAEARTVLERALELRPMLGAAHVQMGLVLFHEREYRDAAQSFWWSLLDDPTLPDIHQFVADALTEMDLATAAMPHLRHLEIIAAFRGRYLKLPGYGDN